MVHDLCLGRRVTFEGPYIGPSPTPRGESTVWYRETATWRDAQGRRVGSWRWVPGLPYDALQGRSS